jgi:nucleoside-diphosphate-sugar epimerase
VAHYLVTGAAGFIASRVSEMLLAAGHRVTGVDNLNQAYDVRMKEYRLQRLMKLPDFSFMRMDVSDRQAVAELDRLKPFDAVLNLAARAGVRAAVEDPWIFVDTNMTGTLNMLELSQRCQVPKFILASTSSIYGLDAPIPTPETASSDHPLQAYAASKKGAEALCHVYHHLYGLDVTIFRYFTVYGPAGRPDMVMFRFTQWIAENRPVHLTGDGNQSRGFTYLDDIAAGTILGLKPLGYEIINLGGHESITMNQLIRRLETLIGEEAQVEHIPFHPADMLANLADISKARRLLGWEPQVDLETGMRRMVDWYMAERAWTSQLVTK